MSAIALLPHTGKPQAVALARELVPRLIEAGAVVCADSDTAAVLGVPGITGELARADAAVVLGGDGALLRAARLLSGLGVPILGVNLGHMGFLTEIDPPELDEAIQRLLAGKYRVEERMMIEARIARRGCHLSDCRALNDVVIARGTFARMVRLEAYVEESPLATFVGDGLILATPTGSTAYSLSAGGPIAHPGIDGIVVTPICPHALGARSVIARADDTIRIRVQAPAEHDELMLTADGQPVARLLSGDEVLVSRAPTRTRLIRIKERTFYDVLSLHLRNPE